MAYLVELTEPRVVGLREYPTPEPGVGEVRVQTMYSGISAGTELTIYRGTNPYLDKQWDPRTALFLPGSRFLSGSSTFSYPVDAWGYSRWARSTPSATTCRGSRSATSCGASGDTARMPCCRRAS